MAEAMKLPFFHVNALTGIKGAKVIEDPKTCADLIRKAVRPLLVIGARAIEHFVGDKLHLEYCLELAKKQESPSALRPMSRRRRWSWEPFQTAFTTSLRSFTILNSGIGKG